jgi:hypothetical protein
MPIVTPKYRFHTAFVEALAPDTPGVYALYSGGVIYYGRSDVSVRDRLRSHLSGAEGSCTQNASEFNTEATYSAAAREEQLLREHLAWYGALPRCNEKVG